MSTDISGRRDVLEALGAIATSGTGFTMTAGANAHVDEAVRWSTGTASGGRDDSCM